MMRLAIIPARGGSKRVPGKNMRPFLGKPIIGYVVQAAIDSRLFDEVMVSTDDDSIATLAKGLGASVPFKRSEKSSDDFATTADVLLEVIKTYQTMLGRSFEYACCIYPTAPFVTPDKLRSAFDLLVKGHFDSVFPVLRYAYPIQRALAMEMGKVSMLDKRFIDTRSQDLEPRFHDSGQFYWFSIKAFMEKGRLMTDNAGAIPISELEAQDIDTISDWHMAELKFQLMRNKISNTNE